MIKFDVTKQNINKHSPRCPVIYNYPYRILIIGASGSGKTNSFFNLKSKQPEFDKIYLYAEHPHEAKYRFLINRRKSTGFFNDSKAFIEYSNDIDDIYENIAE